MTLKEQLYVCTLARCKTISKASEELFISQPALSVYISNLEKCLKTKLFVRTGKEFVLTYAGEEYVKRATKMLEMKEEFDRIVEEVNRDYADQIRVGIQHRRAVGLLPPVTPIFMKEYPRIALNIFEGIHSELVEKYEKHQIDVFVGVYKDELTDAEYIPIANEHVLLVLPAGHPANKLAGPPKRHNEVYPHLDIGHLNHENFVLPTKDQSLRMSIDRIMEEHRIIPGRVMELSYFETIMAMIEQGIGIGFNRESYLGSMIQNPNLRHYRIGEQSYTSQIVIAHRKGKVPSHVRRLEELLVRQARKLMPEDSYAELGEFVKSKTDMGGSD